MLLSSYCKLFSLSVWFLTQASEDLLREHYIDLKDRPFYDGLVQYMHSGPVVAMVSSWQGKPHCLIVLSAMRLCHLLGSSLFLEELKNLDSKTVIRKMCC